MSDFCKMEDLSDERMIVCYPNSSKLYKSHEICKNRVTFVNVKLKYPIDEDITVNYTLQKEFKSSTRDWIGIFPRNWMNLQQYLTFEYTHPASPNAENPLSRTISFRRTFHSAALLDTEYQFGYVSREIQIMALSSYFRFTPSLSTRKLNAFPSTELFASTIGDADFAKQKLCDNGPVLSWNEENPVELEKSEEKIEQQTLRNNCHYCHRRIRGLKIDTLRGDFLASFNESLLNRVRRLESDLNFADSALKNVKGARENLAKRLQAYEAFVAEMLKSVAIYGFVNITNERGKEIILQRVNSNDHFAEGCAKVNNELENEIVALKSLIEEQQQTIAEFIEHRKLKIFPKDRIKVVDREIQTDEISNSYTQSGVLQQINTDEIKENSELCEEKISSVTIEEADENLNLVRTKLAPTTI